MSTHQQIRICGAGIVGLSCALLLAKDGHQITVVARDLPGDKSQDWSSPWAGALLAPHPDYEQGVQEATIRFYQSLLADYPDIGIRKTQITEYYNDRDDFSTIWYKHVYPNFKALPRSELPAHAKIGFTYDGLVVNPDIFMPWLYGYLSAKGVKIVRGHVDSLEEAHAGADIVINATGLGARGLAQDPKVYEGRGQTMFVHSGFDRAVILQGSEYTYVIPRAGSGGVILGGVSKPYATDRNVDPDLRPDILRRVNQITDGAFTWVNPDKDAMDIVGFRPCREDGLRIERCGNMVHAYGCGGLGYVFAFGTAAKVRDLVQQKSRL